MVPEERVGGCVVWMAKMAKMIRPRRHTARSSMPRHAHRSYLVRLGDGVVVRLHRLSRHRLLFGQEGGFLKELLILRFFSFFFDEPFRDRQNALSERWLRRPCSLLT